MRQLERGGGGAALLASAIVVGCLGSEEPSTEVGGTRAGVAESSDDQVTRAFLPNRGQLDAPVQFYAAGEPGIHLTPSGATIAMVSGGEPRRGHVLQLRMLGARSDTTLRAGETLEGHANHFIGDSSTWQRELPRLADVVYEEPWPGIDLRVTVRGGTLKYELVVSPGGDISDARMRYDGAESVTEQPDGSLRIETPLGAIEDAAPVAHQDLDGERRHIAASFELEADGSFGFEVGEHDPSRPLVVDPGLTFGTFLGGSDTERAQGVAVDGDGNVHVTGRTHSGLGFPHTSGPFAPSGDDDVYVTKLDPTLSTVIYSTLIGGSGFERSTGIALDGSGRAIVGGATRSSDFPTTGDLDDEYEDREGFVLELDEAGDLAFSTFLGGDAEDSVLDVAVDGDGSIYAGGRTASSDFPVTSGTFGSSGPFFVTKISRFRTFVEFSGRSSGPANELELMPATAGDGLLVAGTRNRFGPEGAELFEIRRLEPEGTDFAWTTQLDGSDDDELTGLAVGPDGSAFVTGFVHSDDFPTTPGAFDRDREAFFEPVIAKLDPDGGIVYSTFFGDVGDSWPNAIAVGADGTAYVVGGTIQDGVHIVDGSLFDTYQGGGTDGFVTRVRPDGSGLIHSTYLGGSGMELGFGRGDIAVSGPGEVIVVGETQSEDFPVTTGAYDTTFNGGSEDAFVAKMSLDYIPKTVIAFPANEITRVDDETTFLAEVLDSQDLPVPGSSVLLSLGGKQPLAACETDADGTCELAYRNATAGTFSFTVWADVDGDGLFDGDEPSDQVIHAFAPSDASERGHVAGAGRIETSDGRRIYFHVAVGSGPDGVHGSCLLYDRDAGEALWCQRIDAFARYGDHAVFAATIRRAGQRERAVFTLGDLGSWGRDTDHLELLTDGGYEASGTLELGNVYVYR